MLLLNLNLLKLTCNRTFLLGACAVAIAACSASSGSPNPPANTGNNPPPATPVAVHGQLAVVGTQLRDQAGNPVQLKGASSQWLNYESRPYPESKAGIAYARDHWNLSVIRAAMGTEAKGGYLNGAAGKAAMQ